MIRKVIDYVKEDAFEVRADNNYLCIINYTDIRFMEEEKILVQYYGGSLLVKGSNLTVVKLLEEEMLIKGNFQTIEFRRNHE